MLFESDTAPRLSFAPLTLLSAMWLQLAGEGKSVAVVATRTGTNAATVRAWLATTRKRGKGKI